MIISMIMLTRSPEMIFNPSCYTGNINIHKLQQVYKGLFSLWWHEYELCIHAEKSISGYS